MEDSIRGGCNYIGTEHLLAGILREGNNMAVRILRTAGVDARGLYSALMRKLSEQPRSKAGEAKGAAPREEKGKNLREFTRDLTADARAGRLDPPGGGAGPENRSGRRARRPAGQAHPLSGPQRHGGRHQVPGRV